MQNPNLGKIDFKKEFPELGDDMAIVFKSLLEFNPHFRYSASSLLKLPVFDDIRDQAMEEPAPFKIKVPIDEEGYS